MDIVSARNKASNPHSSIEQLYSLIGIDDEIDQLLATHPNSDSVFLEKLIDQSYDENTHRKVYLNPNVPIQLVRDYGHQFPEELLINSAFFRIITEFPLEEDGSEIFDEIPKLLALPDCPYESLRHYSIHGTRLQQLMILSNPAITSDIHDLLGPDYFIQSAQTQLDQISEDLKNPKLRKYLESYRNTSLQYCMPSFLPLDPNNPSHRMEDQFLKGFPFTSASWPWPQNEAGRYLQPLAQINLVDAGENLGTKLGQGLLQVWMDVFEPVLRIVPLSSLNEKLDTFYPDDQPWNDENLAECPILEETSKFPYPRVKWIPLGKMWPSPKYACNEFWGDVIDFYDREKAEFEEKLTVYGIPFEPLEYFGTNRYFSPFLRLGGYQSGSGNEADICDWPKWPLSTTTNSTKILLYIGCEFHTFAITYYINDIGDVKFGTSIATDR